MENDEKIKQAQATQSVSRFIINVLLFASAGLIIKLAWNIGIASIFPLLPKFGYLNAVSILLFIYVISRIISAGLMAETKRTVVQAVQALELLSVKLTDFLKEKRWETYSQRSQEDKTVN